MKYISSIERTLLTTLIITALTTFACRKENMHLNKQGNHILKFLRPTEDRIRINQAVTVFDSNVIKDSIDFASPPSDKYYEWNVIPNNGCDSFVGDKNKGIIDFAFHCSGTYFLTAKIYDSLTHSLIGTTDTLKINVTSDTLHPTQPIKDGDILNIRPGIAKRYSDIKLPPDEVWIALILSSTKLYDSYSPYIQFDYLSNINANNNSYVFNDIRLDSYPFAYGTYETTSIIQQQIDLHGLTYGVPKNLNVTWLGITYSGSITLLNENQYSVNWDNSGGVNMK